MRASRHIRRIIRLTRPIFQTRSRKLYETHREQARALIHERVRHYLEYYGRKHGITVGKIAVRNQRSRWGSCSRKGNLNFNYKLVFLSPELRDYVIIHEICHRKEFNHGRGFWNLVAEVMPEYRQCRVELNKITNAPTTLGIS